MKGPIYVSSINWMGRVLIGPLGSCFHSLPPGDKTFSRFQKGLSPPVNLKPPEPFPTPIKWKEYQLDPLGAAFAASLWGSVFFFPVNIEKVPVNNMRKMPVNISQLPVNKCQKCAREQRKSAREQKKRCPWTRKVPVNNQKVPVNHQKVPVKTSKKVPVNASFCPWIHSKKCPWTQICTREHLPKIEVHAHF